MQAKQLNRFKSKLEARRRELQRAVSRGNCEGRTVGPLEADPADRASESYQKEHLFRESQNARLMLRLTEQALRRVQEGTFGECALCTEAINAKRLEAVPWTRYCRDCQEELERSKLRPVDDRLSAQS
jgi:RNA polymerase-binding transcription factor